jgi:23S rRNA (guanosine2251-2'-O)-methyltransferase
VFELLEAAPERVTRVIVTRRDPPPELVERARARSIPLEHWEPDQLERLVPGLDARGVVAEASPPPALEAADLWTRALQAPAPRVVAALDGVQDPQNLGAIMRSCEYFGVSGLLWAKDRSAPLSPSVVRASAGASERLPLAVVPNLVRALEGAKKHGFWVLGTVVDDGRSLADLVADDAVHEPVVVVFGAEHRGLRRLTRERCDVLATIPRRGGVGSLNVAAAAAATLAMIVGVGGGRQ